MHFEIESDKDVLLDAIGELKAGESHKVSEDELALFRVYHGVSLPMASFASGVKVTAVVGGEE